MTLDIDTLAQEIRRVDGNHSLGAGALAEALMPFLRSYIESHTGEAVAWRMRDFGDGWIYSEKDPSKYAETVGAKVEPLFASPVQPVKLEWIGTSLRYNGIVIGHIDRQDMSDPTQWVARLGVGYDVTPTVIGFLRGDSAGELQAIAEARSALESAARKWLSGGDK